MMTEGRRPQSDGNQRPDGPGRRGHAHRQRLRVGRPIKRLGWFGKHIDFFFPSPLPSLLSQCKLAIAGKAVQLDLFNYTQLGRL